MATGHGAALGAMLRAQGVRLPVALRADAAPGDAAATDTDPVALRRSLASLMGGGGGGASAARAMEAWIGARGEAEAGLVWEALRAPEGVRVYADLSQAADELAAMSSAMEA